MQYEQQPGELSMETETKSDDDLCSTFPQRELNKIIIMFVQSERIKFSFGLFH